jgi:hypothetical protein
MLRFLAQRLRRRKGGSIKHVFALHRRGVARPGRRIKWSLTLFV